MAWVCQFGLILCFNLFGHFYCAFFIKRPKAQLQEVVGNVASSSFALVQFLFSSLWQNFDNMKSDQSVALPSEIVVISKSGKKIQRHKKFSAVIVVNYTIVKECLSVWWSSQTASSFAKELQGLWKDLCLSTWEFWVSPAWHPQVESAYWEISRSDCLHIFHLDIQDFWLIAK